MRLVLIADDVRADLKNQFVAGIELEQLRLAWIGSLKDPQVSLRVERDRRNSSKPWRQHVRVTERVAHRLFPLHALQRLSRAAKAVAAERRATTGRGFDSGRRRSRNGRGSGCDSAAARR